MKTDKKTTLRKVKCPMCKLTLLIKAGVRFCPACRGPLPTWQKG